MRENEKEKRNMVSQKVEYGRAVEMKNYIESTFSSVFAKLNNDYTHLLKIHKQHNLPLYPSEPSNIHFKVVTKKHILHKKHINDICNIFSQYSLAQKT